MREITDMTNDGFITQYKRYGWQKHYKVIYNWDYLFKKLMFWKH